MACKLCCEDASLCLSHIVPETFWKHLYNEKHQALPVSVESGRYKFVQAGYKERLLCKPCETRLSKWERILSKDLNDIGSLTSNYLSISLEGSWIKVSGIQYEKFKLAVLSILWRMSISSHKFYSSYKLGKYEQLIRELLLSDKPILDSKFSIFITRMHKNEKYIRGIHVLFEKKVSCGYTIQSFIISGFWFRVVINEKVLAKHLDTALRSDGTVLIKQQDYSQIISNRNVFSRLTDPDVMSFHFT